MYIYDTISLARIVLHRMRNIVDKNCKENQNIHFVFNTIFQNIVPYVRQRGKIWNSQKDRA